MQLYTVHFTTKQLVSKFDDKGRKIGEYETEYPQTLHALPRSTAESYKKFGNWSIEPYYSDLSQRPMTSKKAKTEYRGVPNGMKKAASAPNTSRTVPNGTTSVRNAAASGDLAAAINAGAK